MYHPYKKDSSYLREAIYRAYNGKCFYCSANLKLRYMHIDHILPSRRAENNDEEIKKYVQELEQNGFEQDSIENYAPTCPRCNLIKGNWVFEAHNIRFYHETARKHLDKILSNIELIKKTELEYFYEPVDLSIWEELTFKEQRDLSHAIMGYALTDRDVNACPIFPQVNTIEKQLNIVDYAVIQGEPGCGKSISLYQVAYRFFKNGWSVYLLRKDFIEDILILPNSTEKALFIIDDAQTLSDGLLDFITRQSRDNRKVLLAKTISDKTNSDSVILTKKDAVNILYREFLNRKDEIWPIVKRYDNKIGVNFSDLPIERRLEAARKANTPWQFTYILRGGWSSMKEWYSSVYERNNCELLAAAIATFQILQLDKAVNFDRLCEEIQTVSSNKYKWSSSDLDLLIDRKIVLSKDNVRIVHLESANVIAALFFDAPENEKQGFLIRVIEDALLNKEISPLGIVWLCNGCNRYVDHIWRIEDKVLTDRIIDNMSEQLYKPNTSEEIRNIIYLLEQVIVCRKKDKGVRILLDNKDQIIDLINNADSISASGFSELLNSLYNYDHKTHNSLSSQISWPVLMKRMMQEEDPNYYTWGKLFNRGLSLLGQKRYSSYSTDMYEVLKELVPKATVFNIEGITAFISSVSFLNYIHIPAIITALTPVYKQLFENNTEQAIYLVDFDFMCNIFGMDLFEGKKSKIEGLNEAAKLFIDIIPEKKVARVISNSSVHEWLAIREFLYFIYCFDKEKYTKLVKQIDLKQLSVTTKSSWDQNYEISLIFESLAAADTSIAKNFLTINEDKITIYYPAMIIVDPKSAIKASRDKNIKLDLFAGHYWNDILSALRALYREDKLFCEEYLRNNISLISDKYSNVCALDFTERAALDLLKLIQTIDAAIYSEILAGINKDKVLKRWDQCSGINPRKIQWVNRRKKTFFEILGIESEGEL